MPPGEEDLAAGLNLTGGGAWMRLHGNFTSQIMVPVAIPGGETANLPMPAVRNLAADPALAAVLADTRRRLEVLADRTNDPWLIGERPVP